MSDLPYAELQVTSNFSFLRGASHPEELVERAAGLGYRAIAITDHGSLAGIVRAHLAAKHAGIRLIVGCRLDLSYAANIWPLLVYPKDRQAYGRLCALLTLARLSHRTGEIGTGEKYGPGKRRTDKGGCLLCLEDLLDPADTAEGQVFIIPRPAFNDSDFNRQACGFFEFCKQLKTRLPNEIYLTLTRSYGYNHLLHEEIVIQIARALRIPLIATGDVHYHRPERRALQDVLTCTRLRTTIQEAAALLSLNAERYLKPPAEIYRLFKDQRSAVERTLEAAELLAGFSLEQLRYEYPDEICADGLSPQQYLRNLVDQGSHQRYPDGVPQHVSQALNKELALIRELNYEKYFLTCYDIVKFARSRGILCQGRGAAANSAVCFCLGITSVDPARIDLLFARFISKERNEPPDIDIDFEHERREEVIQYIYQKYGRERAGLVCEVVTYRYRSAVRDVGKALGLSLEVVDKLAKSIHRWVNCAIDPQDLAEIGIRADSTVLQNVLTLCAELRGFPRHLSQHVGGFVITQHALSETVPILNAFMPNRTIIEWDKDDIEALGMLKIDILALGMLSCVRKALELVNRRLLQEARNKENSHAAYPLQFHSIPAEDPEVYDMICAADTIGVFQIESRAQMSMLPRLKPRCFYDLVIEVAIVRPGPIQGNMVHPYLKRRAGLERVHYPDQRVAAILAKTLGVPLFQEQAMRLAIVLANFTPGEAEQLRRAMAAWKRDKGIIASFKRRIMAGMTANGYSAEFSENCINQIKGFSEYGFPESHAASFALIVYASAWLKCRYPAEFAAALLNSQPMGFYAPSQIVRDAAQHGIEVRAIDVNYSAWDHIIEGYNGAAESKQGIIRLGMRLVNGLMREQACLISEAVNNYGKFVSVQELWLKTYSKGLKRSTLELLASADAFHSMNLCARRALWEIKGLPREILPLDPRGLLETAAPAQTSQLQLPLVGPQQAMFQDYTATGLSLRAHPIGFIRQSLNARGASTAAALKNSVLRNKQHVSLAGIAIVRQRPGTAKGVVFITLEDETGIANLIIKPAVFERHHRIVMSSSCLLARGVLERVGEVVYVNTDYLESLDQAVLASNRASGGMQLPSRSYSY